MRIRIQNTRNRAILLIVLGFLAVDFVNTDDTGTINNALMASANNSSKMINTSMSPHDVRSNGIMPFVPMRIIDKENGTMENVNKEQNTTTVKTMTTTPSTGSEVTTEKELPTTTQKQLTTTKAIVPTTSDRKTTSTIEQTTVVKQSTTGSKINVETTKSLIITTEKKDRNLSTVDTNKYGTSTTELTSLKQTTDAPIKNQSTLKPVSRTTEQQMKSSLKLTTQNVKNSVTSASTESHPVSDRIHLNVTESFNMTTDPMRILVIYTEDDFLSHDSFWPIALALTIGIPTIIVMAVTITVLYRRRMSNPRSRMSVYAGHDYSTM